MRTEAYRKAGGIQEIDTGFPKSREDIRCIDIDRFSGEAEEPLVWGWCGYCADNIHTGDKYFLHEGLAVCEGCAKRYAYSVFERDASVKTAQEQEGGSGD